MQNIGKDFISQLKQLISNEDVAAVNQFLKDLHPADIAEILDDLKTAEANFVYHNLDKDLAADVMVELEEDVREKLLEELSSKEIAEEVIEKMDSDDAADVISELSEQKKEEVIAHLENEDQASDIIDLLTYSEGTAGALMGKELIQVNQNWPVATCIREMRKQAQDLQDIYTIYVVDDKNTLVGRLSLKKLLFSATSTRTIIKDISENQGLISVKGDEDSESVARIMDKYDLVALPVVNDADQLIGRITIDDVVDVIVEEAEKDYQLASGISEDVESDDSILSLTRARIPWLLIGLAGGIGGAYVIGAFDIENNPELALFIPLIAAMGGNVGVQSAAIVVQGIANQSIKDSSISTRLIKELGVGLLNGIICSIIILGASLILNFPLYVAITVSISLLIVIIFAALFGTFVPMALNKYKIDPALATGPFITTANDIIGLIIYFLIGNMVADMLV